MGAKRERPRRRWAWAPWRQLQWYEHGVRARWQLRYEGRRKAGRWLCTRLGRDGALVSSGTARADFEAGAPTMTLGLGSLVFKTAARARGVGEVAAVGDASVGSATRAEVSLTGDKRESALHGRWWVVTFTSGREYPPVGTEAFKL
jgi:hypothetical protein